MKVIYHDEKETHAAYEAYADWLYLDRLSGWATSQEVWKTRRGLMRSANRVLEGADENVVLHIGYDALSNPNFPWFAAIDWDGSRS